MVIEHNIVLEAFFDHILRPHIANPIIPNFCVVYLLFRGLSVPKLLNEWI